MSEQRNNILFDDPLSFLFGTSLQLLSQSTVAALWGPLKVTEADSVLCTDVTAPQFVCAAIRRLSILRLSQKLPESCRLA
jgi:hypothetical protein